MKLLRVTANSFRGCADGFTVSFIPTSKKTSEDKQYELLEIADSLYVFNTIAFVGKNASGKTTAIELLDCAYTILGTFRLDGGHRDYGGTELEIYFYHNGNIYLYHTLLRTDNSIGNRALFTDEHIFMQSYRKTNIKRIFDRDSFKEQSYNGILPEDTSRLFFVLGKSNTAAVYYDSFGTGADTYNLTFKSLKAYNIETDILTAILRIFDDNILGLTQADERNYVLELKSGKKALTDTQLIYLLSSGTTRGMLLYIMAVASLQNGFDLLIDEIESHFHKTLVENLLSLYKDKSVNRHNATLVFTTHYCELLDRFGRQDNIWVCHSGERVELTNMYSDYGVRCELLKSKQFYNNTFGTAVNYDALMDFKKRLKK